MILPNVKQYEQIDGICPVPETVTYSAVGELAAIGAEAFSVFAVDAIRTSEDAFLEFVFDGSLEDRDEIYSIRITADRIRVSFRDRRGAVNGAASIALLLKKRELSPLL